MNNIIFSKLKEDDKFDAALGDAMIEGNLMKMGEKLMFVKKRDSKFYVCFPRAKVVEVRVYLWNLFNSELVQTISGNNLKETQKGRYCKFSLCFPEKQVGYTILSRVTFVIVVRNEISDTEEEIDPKIVVPLYNGGKGSVDKKMKHFSDGLVNVRSNNPIRIKRKRDNVTEDAPAAKKSKPISASNEAIIPHEIATTTVVPYDVTPYLAYQICNLLVANYQTSLQQQTDQFASLLLSSFIEPVVTHESVPSEQENCLEEQGTDSFDKFLEEQRTNSGDEYFS